MNDSNTRLRIRIISHGFVASGEVTLPSRKADVSGKPVRLIELFNNPGLRDDNIYGQPIDSLLIENAKILGPNSDLQASAAAYIRREDVICVFQEVETTAITNKKPIIRTTKRSPNYEASLAERSGNFKKERVGFILNNGLRIEGDYFRGTKDLALQPTKDFIVVANATVKHASEAFKERKLEFVILRNNAISAFWKLK